MVAPFVIRRSVVKNVYFYTFFCLLYLLFLLLFLACSIFFGCRRYLSWEKESWKEVSFGTFYLTQRSQGPKQRVQNWSRLFVISSTTFSLKHALTYCIDTIVQLNNKREFSYSKHRTTKNLHTMTKTILAQKLFFCLSSHPHTCSIKHFTMPGKNSFVKKFLLLRCQLLFLLYLEKKKHFLYLSLTTKEL